MTDQQVQVMIWHLAQKVDDLESRLKRITRVVSNIDGNTAQIANIVRELVRKSR